MRVRYTARAFAERERIFSYLEARNPQAARRVIGLIMQRIDELGSEPYKGRPTDRGGLFTLWVRPIHIRHTSRKPWRG
jgi:plasmid stabilization system protein ParE